MSTEPKRETTGEAGTEMKSVGRLVDEFHEELSADRAPRIESFLGRVEDERRSLLLRRLIALEIEVGRASGRELDPEDYLRRFPEDLEVVTEVLAEWGDVWRRLLPELSAGSPGLTGLPQAIGRYPVRAILSEGGFGRVYLARDEELERDVAIKVPTLASLGSEKHIRAFMEEARLAASLRHPSVVRVYDVGRLDDGSCYVVLDYIEGCRLDEYLRRDRPSIVRKIEILLEVGEAVRHAHARGLVHRDLKPGNVLLDSEGRPYVTDFGLAVGAGGAGTSGLLLAGTPPYMAPEQVRQEAHRFDGRTDIWAIGVLLYEMLTGSRPFRGNTTEEVFRQIELESPPPPSDLERSTPPVLERICLRCLSKRMSGRYPSLDELLSDLRLWHRNATARRQHDMALSPGAVEASPAHVVPKGIRPFEPEDAYFFLDLLPGPRDREGLPEIIRFWKTRVERDDLDHTFEVGVIYGPSGCGKTSLCKSGLIPRLGPRVTTVYLEATRTRTEQGLLRALGRKFEALSGCTDLVEAVRRLRGVLGEQRRGKALIVIDQFEQWLQLYRPGRPGPLIDALRQCDGRLIQCILLVRDDFWLALSRLMRAAEIPLVEGRNTTLVDLFDRQHTRRVLLAMGRALGRFPRTSHGSGRTESRFLDLATDQLAPEGAAVPMQIALFCEILGDQPWVPATLERAGGTEGLGVAFLEKSLGSGHVRSRHREAAQAVLQALVTGPGPEAEIRGRMCSRMELLAATGYPADSGDFSDLMNILETELKLIAPVDPAGLPEPQTDSGDQEERCFQIAHDYLVPSIRQWLSRKRLETHEGRALLKLQSRSALWRSAQEARMLPSLCEWLAVCLFTKRRSWSTLERTMMGRATRFHLGRLVAGIVALLAIVAAGFHMYRGGLELQLENEARILLEKTLGGDTRSVPGVIAKMEPYRSRLNPWLQDTLSSSEPGSRRRLHARLALLPEDPGQVEPLYGRMLNADPASFGVILKALRPSQDVLVPRLWQVILDPGTNQARLLRAACALADYDPDGDRWTALAAPTAAALISRNRIYLDSWIEYLEPIAGHLIEPLNRAFLDSPDTDSGILAAEVLSVLAAGDLAVLGRLLVEAHPAQLRPLIPALVTHYARARPRLRKLALTQASDPPRPESFSTVSPPEANPETLLDERAKVQAKAAVVMLAARDVEVIPKVLEKTGDRRVRTYVVQYVARAQLFPRIFAQLLLNVMGEEELKGLLFALGGYRQDIFAVPMREQIVLRVEELLESHHDPGVHGAAEWFLREWGEKDRVRRVLETLATSGPRPDQDWFVTPTGHTMTIIRGPLSATVGTAATDWYFESNEERRTYRIPRTVAISTREVTRDEFAAMDPEHPGLATRYNPEPECPALYVTWFDAVRYCRWLSEREGLPEDQMCYPPLEEIGPGMSLPGDILRRTGYRLPTDTEWELACRAGTETSRYYGHDLELLPAFAWYSGNSADRSHPVGRLRPNDLGLFDTHGNAWEWCHTRYEHYRPRLANDELPPRSRERTLLAGARVVRGGGFSEQNVRVRSALRAGQHPGFPGRDFGFRIARTLETHGGDDASPEVRDGR